MSIRDVDELLARMDLLIAEEQQPGPLLQVGRRLTDDEAEEIAARWRAAHATGIRTAVVAGPVELLPAVDVPWWRRALATLRRPRW